ncbi:hypothetical protein AcV5_001625 [Taiwanofungus camphoratus]|nr:hypothetical protein AcV5_001625 [Antrodia cinnamomea]
MISDVHPFNLNQEDQGVASTLTGNDLRKWILSKKEEHQTYPQTLDVLYNSSLPVNQLPNELLVEIFSCVKERDGDMQWMKFTGVCGYWRAVAVSTPKLWSQIDLGKGVAFLRLCLERSQNAAADIFCRTWVLETPEIVEALLPHVHRIRSLRMSTTESLHPSLEELLPLLNFPMPRLETLVLNPSNPYNNWQDELLFKPIVNQFPSLQHLSLSFVGIPWKSPVYKGLRSLSLSNHGKCPPLSIDAFLNMMEACPCLEQLALSESGPSPPPEVDTAPYPPPKRVVSLPKLRQLEVMNVPVNVSYLLDHLAIPASAMAFIRCLLRDFDELGGNAFASALPRYSVPSSLFAEVQRINVDMTSPFRLSLVAWNDASGSSLIPSFIMEISPLFSTPIPRPPYLFQRILEEIVSNFSASPVQELSLMGNSRLVTKGDWVDALSHFSSLRILRVCSGVDVDQLFTALSLRPIRRPEDGILCPNLKQLCVTGHCGRETVDILVTTLHSRALQGCRLDELDIINEADPSLGGREIKTRLENMANNVKYHDYSAWSNWES